MKSRQRERATHALNSVLIELVSTSVMPVSEEMHPWQASSWVVWVELGQMHEMTPVSVRSGHSVGQDSVRMLAVCCCRPCAVCCMLSSVDGVPITASRATADRVQVYNLRVTATEI